MSAQQQQQQAVTDKLKYMVKNLVKLPTLPSVVSAISSLMANPNVSVADINKVISKDAALSAKVLKLVNSPFYGFPRKVTTISHAIIVLGFNTVRDLVLSVSVFDTFKGESKTLDKDAFWKHSIGVGVATRILAKRAGYTKLEEVFLAGLLHDIGKIVLDQFANQLYIKILAMCKEKNLLLYDVERAALGVTHSEVGKWLADSWNLPFDLSEAIEFHHSPPRARNAKEVVMLVHCADIFCRSIDIGNGGDNKIPIIDETAWQYLRLTEETMPDVLKAIGEEFDAASAFLKATK